MNAVMKWLETMQGEPQQIQANSATTTYRVAATPGVLTITRSMLLFKLLKARPSHKGPTSASALLAGECRSRRVQALVAAGRGICCDRLRSNPAALS